VKKNAILEAVANVTKRLQLKRHVPVENTIFKCLLEIQNIEKAVKTQFQFVECHAVKNYSAATLALEAAIKGLAQTAK
jgi:hypothetical protein